MGDETWAPEMTDFGESIDTDMFARAARGVDLYSWSS